MAWRELALNLSQRGHRLLMRAMRPLTLGVRGIVIDPEERVFLVRHSYVPGWHFPGGGVEPGETLLEALARELREEGNIELGDAPPLHGLFFNASLRRDHVAAYVVRSFQQTAPRGRDWEIVETGFFSLRRLPEEATRATRDRIAELLGEQPISQLW